MNSIVVNEDIEVREAFLSELEKLQVFMLKEWKYKKEFYERFFVFDNRLMFVVGVGVVTGKIYAAVGLIPVDWQSPNKEYQLTQLLSDNIQGFSVLNLFRFINSHYKPTSISAVGVRPQVIPLYKLLGYNIGELNHYYKLNDLKHYCFAVISDKRISVCAPGNVRLEEINYIDQLKEYDYETHVCARPYKDYWHFEYKYHDVKGHEYKIYKVIDESGVWSSIIVMREVYERDSVICKIVDYVGEDDDIAGMGQALDRLMKEKRYEFIDFYNIGIAHSIMEAAGFNLLDETDPNIIPHYTEPLIQSNKTIYYITSITEHFHGYIGDDDQDISVVGYT